MADPRKWKHFERLVAAIHRLADEGADVRWNDKISGRQFDVTIRFKRGLYQYLTVIECKDYSRAVPVGEVDAFVTKSVDAKADRGVMASSSGFQAGAQEVAKRHNITLIHVSDTGVSFPPRIGPLFCRVGRGKRLPGSVIRMKIS
jgi:predicted helicase